MKQCIDIYNKWIVTYLDGTWRHVYVPAGWVAFAPRDKPNQHLGVCPDTSIDATGARDVKHIGSARAVLVGGQVTDRETLAKIDTHRFGWAGTISGDNDASQLETQETG